MSSTLRSRRAHGSLAGRGLKEVREPFQTTTQEVEWMIGSSFGVHVQVADMTPAEYVAHRTWSILGRARALRSRFGEESLTDLLVLDMLPYQRARGFWLSPTTKQEEASCGADLLVAVRHRTGHWSRLVLQAKKLYPEDNYRMLNRGQKCFAQLKKLERCARHLRALPLYLLYNHTKGAQASKDWCCTQPFAPDQLGCTLVPSWRIREMIRGRPPRTFDQAHRVSQSMLWRCAFDCPDAEKLVVQSAFRTSRRDTSKPLEVDDRTCGYDWSFEPQATAWPEWLLDKSTTELTLEEFDQLRRDLSGADDAATFGPRQEPSCFEENPVYPARLLVVDQFEEPMVRSPETQAR